MSRHERARYKFEIKGIDCADCAAKLESKIAKIEGISNVSLSFLNSSLQYECNHDEAERIEKEVREVSAKEEPEAVITSKGHKHLHSDEHEEHHHEHHHEHECHDEHECGCHHEEERALYKFEIKGIDCADCAAKLESKIAKIEGISNVSLSFLNSSLQYECNHDEAERIEKEVREVSAKEEPEAVITSKGHKHLHSHEHEEHHHEHEKARHETADTRKYTISGMDCADCAAKLEHKLSAVPGVSDLRISFINSTLVYDCADEDLERVEQEIRRITAKEEPEAVISAPAQVQKSDVQDDEDDDEKTMLVRLIIGAVLFVLSIVMKDQMRMIMAIASWLVLGYDVLIKAVKGIGRGQVFDEHFLMAVATIAAIYLKDYREAAGVMLFYQIGEYFQDMAVRRSRKSIGELMDIRPDYAWVNRGGDYVKSNPEDVRVDDVILVKPGERIPLDGIITNGASTLNTASLTGESKLSDVDVGDEVYSGAVNETGVLEIRVTKEYGDSTVARILELVENTDSNKASHEKFITKFSRWYTPLVVFSAIITAILTAVITGDINEGVRRACTFLVISCPCALVISIPLSFFAGIGGLSARGVLVKGANVIEAMADVKQVVLDKTGTLTTGVFKVEKIISSVHLETALRDAAYAEHFSNHPLAQSIRSAYGKEISDEEITDVKEISGRGLCVHAGDREILAGNYKLMKEHGIACEEESDPGTLVYVAADGIYEGCLVLRDQIKDNAADTLRALHNGSVKCIIVSGDRQDITEETGRAIGADEVYGHCLPADKVEHVRRLKQAGGTAFVGDGVNDAPVLNAADVGFAMGALGSDAAIEAADVVIMDDSLNKIPLALKNAARILSVAKQNIYGAIGIKLLILALGAFGIANMWMAIFADTGVAMLCVMNSMRLLKAKE